MSAPYEREQRDLVQLSYAEPVRSPLAAPGEACTYASYFAELLDEWADLPGIGPEAVAAATALRRRLGEI